MGMVAIFSPEMRRFRYSLPRKQSPINPTPWHDTFLPRGGTGAKISGFRERVIGREPPHMSVLQHRPDGASGQPSDRSIMVGDNLPSVPKAFDCLICYAPSEERPLPTCYGARLLHAFAGQIDPRWQPFQR
jgi:hypothetical protein